MKKVLGIFIFILFIVSHPVSAEQIKDFQSNILINRDGSIIVEERIVYDFENVFRHGIFRNIPTIKTNKEGKKFVMDLKVLKVLDQTNSVYQFTTSKKNNTVSIRVGDPNITITGVRTYKIYYQVEGALTYFSDHDELYWNVTGNEWGVSIASSSAVVVLPQEVPGPQLKVACFTGRAGSTVRNCDVYTDGEKLIYETTGPTLESGEGFTIVAGFPKGMVAVLEPKPVFEDTLLGKLLIGLLVIVLLIIGLFWYVFYPIRIIYKWYRYGRDPSTSSGQVPVTAWYEAPKIGGKKITPAECGALLDEVVDERDISATLIDLAVRGFVKIEERKKKDFYILKKKDFAKNNLEEHERSLLTALFSKGDEIRLKDAKLYDEIAKIKDALYERMVTNKLFPKNPNKIRIFYIVIGMLALMTANLFLFVVSLIFGRNMPRKTQAGAEAAQVIKGVKNFLTTQERQLAFQAKEKMMFEKLLPFAIAFGVEKIWAERFKDIDLKSPTWYSSYESTRFNSVLFTRSLQSSMSSFSRAVTPTSSSTGHSSGFSGGSSGGGGGGGGGGSW